MVFEGWVANVFNSVLGSYVEDECFRPDKVSTSVYSGHVVLSELELRRDAFDFIEAPMKLKRGFIGKVEFTIPWAKLGSKPVEISMDRVFLVFEPSMEYNAEEYHRKQKARKIAKLAIKTGNDNEWWQDEKDEDGFTSRLRNKIIDNLEFNIRNVHIRYEDRRGQDPFCMGLTLESFKVQSTNQDWQASFVDLASEARRRLHDKNKVLLKLLAYKLFQFEYMSVYMDPLSKQIGNSLDYTICTFAEMSAMFERLIPKQKQQEESDVRFVTKELRMRGKDDEFSDETLMKEFLAAAAVQLSKAKDQHRFLIRPMNATLKMKSNRDRRFPESPDVVADLQVEGLTVALERFQLLNALVTMAEFEAAESSYRYASFRPRVRVHGNAELWWRFALKATRDQVKGQLYRSSCAYITERRKDRLEYMMLWKRKLVGGLWQRHATIGDHYENSPLKQHVLKAGARAAVAQTITPYQELETFEIQELEDMETRLDVDDILFFRSLAESQLRVERARMRIIEIGSRGNTSDSWSRSVFRYAGWAIGISDKKGGPLSMTVEEQEAVLKMLEFDPTNILDEKRKTKVTAGRIVSVFKVKLQAGSLELWQQDGEPKILVDGHFDNLSFQLFKRENGTEKIRASLETVVLYDRCTPHIKFTRLIAPKDSFAFDYLSSGISTTFSEADVMSHLTPPSWNGQAERMERNYRQRMRHVRKKRRSLEGQRRRLNAFREAAAGAATLGDAASEADFLNESDEEIEGYVSDDDSQFSRFKDAGSSTFRSIQSSVRPMEGTVGRPPIFSMQLDTFIPSGAADMALKVRMLPLEIVYSPKVMDMLDEFFQVPESLVSLKESQLATINSLSSNKSRTQAKMEYAFRNHVSISMDMDIQAPLLIIPNNNNSNQDDSTNILLVDLGRITVRDRALSSIRKNELNKPRLRRGATQRTTDNDVSQFFDEYSISLAKVQMLVTDTSQAWRSPVEQKDLRMHIVDDLSFKVVVCVSMLPYDRTLPQLKVFASMPAIHLKLTPDKLATLLGIADSFETEELKYTEQLRQFALNNPLGSPKISTAPSSSPPRRMSRQFSDLDKQLSGAASLRSSTSFRSTTSFRSVDATSQKFVKLEPNDTQSVAGSLSQSLREPLEETINDDDDFFTTVGSIFDHESAGTFISAEQGEDEMSQDGMLAKPKANISLLEWSMDITSIVISLSRPLNTASATLRSTSYPVVPVSPLDRPTAVTPTVKPYVKEWLDELVDMDPVSRVLFTPQRHVKRNSVINDEILDDILDQEEEVYEGGSPKVVEEGVLVFVMQTLNVAISIRSLDQGGDITLESFSVRDVLGQNISKATYNSASMWQEYLMGFPAIVSSASSHHHEPPRPIPSILSSLRSKHRVPQIHQNLSIVKLDFSNVARESPLFKGTCVSANMSLEGLEVHVSQPVIVAMLDFAALVKKQSTYNVKGKIAPAVVVVAAATTAPIENEEEEQSFLAQFKVVVRSVSFLLFDVSDRHERGSMPDDPKKKLLSRVSITDTELKFLTYEDERSCMAFQLGDFSVLDMITGIGSHHKKSSFSSIPEQQEQMVDGGTLMLGSNRREGDKRPLLLLRCDFYPEHFRRRQLMTATHLPYHRQTSSLDLDGVLDSFMIDAPTSPEQEPVFNFQKHPTLDPHAEEAPAPNLPMGLDVKFHLRSFFVRLNAKFVSEVCDALLRSEISNAISKFNDAGEAKEVASEELLIQDQVTRVQASFHDLSLEFPSAQIGTPMGVLVVSKVAVNNIFYFGRANKEEQLEMLKQHPSFGLVMHIIDNIDVVVHKLNFQLPQMLRSGETVNVKVLEDMDVVTRFVQPVGSALVRKTDDGWQWHLLLEPYKTVNRRVSIDVSMLKCTVAESSVVSMIGIVDHMKSLEQAITHIDEESSTGRIPISIEVRVVGLQVGLESQDLSIDIGSSSHSKKVFRAKITDRGNKPIIALQVGKVDLQLDVCDRTMVSTLLVDSADIRDTRPAHCRDAFTSLLHGENLCRIQWTADKRRREVEVALGTLRFSVLESILPDISKWYESLQGSLRKEGMLQPKYEVARRASYRSLGFQLESVSVAPGHSWASDSDHSDTETNFSSMKKSFAPKNMPLQLKLKFDRLEILLLENPKQSDSKSVVMRMAFDFSKTLFATESSQDFTFNVSAMSVGTYALDPDKNLMDSMIILPFHSILVYRERKQELSVSVGALEGRITYEQLRVISSIFNRMSQFTKQHAPIVIAVAAATTPSVPTVHFSTPKPVTRRQLDFANGNETPPPAVRDTVYTTMPRTTSVTHFFKMMRIGVHMNESRFLVVDDMYGPSSPVAELKLLEASANLVFGQTAFKASAYMKACADYFNHRLGVWEPLMEPWDSIFQGNVSTGDDGLCAIKISSNKTLNLNLTESFVETISGAAELWNPEFKQQTPRKRFSSSPVASFYRVRNETGLPIAVWIGSHSHPLNIGEESLLDMSDSNKTITIVIQSSWSPLLNIPVEKEGSVMYRASVLDPSDSSSPYSHLSLVCDVVAIGSTKLITIRSVMLLRNRCTGQMEINAASCIEPTHSKYSRKLAAGETVALPVHIAEMVSTKQLVLQVRPVAYNHTFLFQDVSLPFSTSESLSLRTSLSFPTSDDVACYCGVDCKSGSAAIESLHRDSPLQMNGPSSIAAAIALLSNHQQQDKKTPYSISLGLLSFEPPMTISNVLSTNVTYRVRGALSSVDGQLHVGGSLRWQGVGVEEDVTLSIKLPGFDWSSLIEVEGVRHLDSSVHGKQWFPDTDDRKVMRQSVDLKDANRRNLSVCVETELMEGGARKVTLFVPYWIVNLSDLHLLVRSAARSANLPESFGGHIAAGQNEAIAVMRRLRLRQKLGEKVSYQHSGGAPLPGGLLDLLDDSGYDRQGEPLMFSYTNVSQKKGRICIKATDSGWSQALGLDSAGTTGIVELKQQWNVRTNKPRKVFVIGASIAVGEGKFHRTKVITLTHRFVLINALGRTIKIKQRPIYAKNLSWLPFNRLSGMMGLAKDGHKHFAESQSSLFMSNAQAMDIRPGERSPFHWMDGSLPHEICVRFDEYGWAWSGGFAIDDIGEFYVRLRNEHTHSVYILRVEVSVDKSTSNRSTILITFRPEEQNLPPYRIDNLSLQTLRLQQIGASQQTQEVLLPYHSCPYTWDDFRLPRRLVVQSIGSKSVKTASGSIFQKALNAVTAVWTMLWDQIHAETHADGAPVTLGEFDLDRLQASVRSKAMSHITVGVHADGPTRVLSIVDARNEVSKDEDEFFNTSAWWSDTFDSQVFSIRTGYDSDEGTVEDDELAGISNSNQRATSSFELSVSLNGIGISIVESSPRRELMYLSILAVRVELGHVEDLWRAVFKIGWIQLDNQMYSAYYPVMLAPRQWNATISKHISDKGRPFVECCMVRSDRFPSLYFVRYFSVLILPMNLKLEPELLTAFLPFVNRLIAAASRQTKPRLARTNSLHSQMLKPERRDLILSGGRQADENHSVSLSIDTLQAETSTSRPAGLSLPASRRKLYIEELHIHPVKMHVSFSFRSTKHTGGHSLNPLRFALNAMGATLANVENASLKLNALVLHNSLSTPQTVLGRILGHYKSQARRQAYLILGSVDLLGDPLGLVSNLGAGVLDFFYEPALGLVRSPKDFGAGIAKGTLSLFRRTVLGAATSATGLANGTSALFDSLSNDKYTGYRPRSVAEGLAMGIAGLLVAPMNGFREEGMFGLGQGMIFGCLGLFIKPLAGVLALVKHISVAIQSTIDPSVKYRRHRVRPPRSFHDTGSSKILGVYEWNSAFGEQVLAMVDGGVYFEETHVSHIAIELPIHSDENAATESAMNVYSFYTMERIRPQPKLPLWQKMYLVCTKFHLLYVEDTLEFSRSVWTVPLSDIHGSDVVQVEEVLDDLEDATDTESEKELLAPTLCYWMTVVSYYNKESNSLQKVSIYAWTKDQALQCRKYCQNCIPL